VNYDGAEGSCWVKITERGYLSLTGEHRKAAVFLQTPCVDDEDQKIFTVCSRPWKGCYLSADWRLGAGAWRRLGDATKWNLEDGLLYANNWRFEGHPLTVCLQEGEERWLYCFNEYEPLVMEQVSGLLPVGVSAETAWGFIKALRAEYVRTVSQAVGAFYDEKKVPEDETIILDPYEQEVRAAGEPVQTIHDFEMRWFGGTLKDVPWRQLGWGKIKKNGFFEQVDLQAPGVQTVNKPSLEDFTIMFQFKTTFGWGEPTNWCDGVPMIASKDEFGVSLGQGQVMFGVGCRNQPDEQYADDAIVSIKTPRRYDDDQWHMVVANRCMKSGGFTLWIDGVIQGMEYGCRTKFEGADMQVGFGGGAPGLLCNVKLLARTLTPAHFTEPRFQPQTGYISQGGNVADEEIPMQEATAKAVALGCKGYTFQGKIDDAGPKRIIFKNKWDLDGPDSGWSSVRLEAGFTQYRHGYIGANDNLLVEKMTIEAAKLKCSELEGCLGFTFEGQPTESPVEIYFKSKWDCFGDGWTSYKVEPHADSLEAQTGYKQEDILDVEDILGGLDVEEEMS